MVAGLAATMAVEAPALHVGVRFKCKALARVQLHGADLNQEHVEPPQELAHTFKDLEDKPVKKKV